MASVLKKMLPLHSRHLLMPCIRWTSTFVFLRSQREGSQERDRREEGGRGRKPADKRNRWWQMSSKAGQGWWQGNAVLHGLQQHVQSKALDGTLAKNQRTVLHSLFCGVCVLMQARQHKRRKGTRNLARNHVTDSFSDSAAQPVWSGKAYVH